MPSPQIGRGPLRVPRRQVEPVRERVVDGPERRAAVQADDHVALGVEAHHAGRARVPRGLHVRRHVEDAIAGSHRGLRRDVPGEAEARADVVVVRRHLAAVIVVHEDDRAPKLRRVEEGVGRHSIRQRRDGLLIEVAQTVEALRARNVELEAQAEIQREVARQLPVVLHVPGQVGAGRGGRRVVAHLRVARNAEEHRRQREAFGAARDIRVALRPLRVVEVELARREEQLGEVEQELPVVGAHLHGVRAPHLRHIGVEAVRRRRDDEVGEGRLAERLEVLHVHARELEGVGASITLAGRPRLARSKPAESGRRSTSRRFRP